MALLKGSEPAFQTAEEAAQRRGWAARSELDLRNGLETICRERWPDARVVHELVMGAKTVRADVVAIRPAHIVAFEVKGGCDDTTRLLHQAGMYQLCVPEVWMVVHARHRDDAALIRHLMPSVGLIVGTGAWRDHDRSTVPFSLAVEAEATPRPVVPKMMLEMLWAEELRSACARLRIATGSRSTRPWMISELLEKCSIDELQGAVCAELRCRDALWRADPPMGD